MSFALVFYPHIEHEGFYNFRKKYDPYIELLPEHVTFVFPTPESIGRENLETHISNTLNTWTSFKVHFYQLEKTWDHFLYLGAGEGHDQVVKLHDELYKGILSPYLRKELPFFPHIGLGLFSKEKYDFDNPTAELSLDTERYMEARKEFKELKFDFWCEIDQLTLLKINQDFTECRDLRSFKL